MSKYSLIPEGEMFRIRAEKDFTCQGMQVKKGDLGGLVSSKDNLSQEGTCWIFDEAIVYGRALVQNDVMICDKAIVRGNALLKDKALIEDQVIVEDQAILKGEAAFTGDTIICGKAMVTSRHDCLVIS